MTVRTGLLEGRPWACVAVLTLVNTVNYLDRTLPMILAESLKADLRLSDTMLGVLNGIGFTLVYALAGIPIARLADRGRYGSVISAALAFWSVMTAFGSLATSAWLLGLSRLGVAVGEAGNTPAAHAYISRHFSPHRRAAPLAVLTMAAAIGSMIGLIGGGLMAEALGWRGTMLLMGVFGLVLAPCVLILIGPGDARATNEVGTLAELGASLRNRTVFALLLGLSLMSMASYTLGAFGPAFLVRSHGLAIGQVGVKLGLMNGLIGIASLLATGWLANRLMRRDQRWGLVVLIALTAISIPLAISAFRLSDPDHAIIFVGLSYGVMATYLALTIGPLHSLVPISMRAQASAAALFCTATVGGLGPVITGVISDALTPRYGEQALAYAMLTIPLTLALGAVCYIAACLTIRQDVPLRSAEADQ